ncbi:MAG TPA: DNA cytosine methyltransferase [Candidatus Fimimorpha faecalis]|uniref:Cytosine-specific methyltransferase n=1 Tax=Candidatus Fimimorpha faecalis TaxID=2840824 RepID=A0A9D1EGN3_9FIRM|nr:DNA cytosine methyltransferase [Candidatus Fimimorpha faecalis]
MNCVAVDLFCGIGGLTYGIRKAGIVVAAGIDIDPTCQYAYEENNKSIFINKAVEEIKKEEIESYYPKGCIKILMGCAPCQPFSNYSLRYTKEGPKDEKWRLLYYFSDLVKKIQPEIISMENVPQLVKRKVFDDFVESLNNEGYYVSWKIVNCADYGVPQNRNRLVLLASKLGDISLIEPLYNQKNYITVKDAIGKLPKIKDGECSKTDALHRASKLSKINKRRIKESVPGGTWKDWDESLQLLCHKKSTGQGYCSVYGRMEWEKPSPTITTQFYGYGNGRFGHPEQDRALSMREGAILQSFPPEYKFIDMNHPQTNRQIGIHIGNAVPVKLGEAIGKSILKHLEMYKGE